MTKRHSSLTIFLLLAPAVAAAQGIISTVAGGSGFLDNVPATDARLDGPQVVAVDAQGNAYIADGARIRRVDAKTGTISTLAGGTSGADVMAPQCFAFDANGNLVFLDSGRVMKLDLHTGTASTIAGAYGQTTAQLGIPSGLAADRAGNIYVTDDYYDKIYRIDAGTNTITRIAGVGSAPAGDGGPATQAGLGRPAAITLDPTGNIFFAEQYFLRRIDAQTGIITTIMPVSLYGAAGDGGPIAKAALGNPAALATDSKGNLYVADGPRIRKIDWSAGTISAIAGSGHQNYASDGVPALQANLSFMPGISLDGTGNLWLADNGNHRLFIVSAATTLIRTVAGTASNGDGGPALGALLGYVSGIAVDPGGDIYLGQSNTIRRVDHATGRIATVAQVSTPSNVGGQIALDAARNVFFAAADRINRVDATSGNVTTVAGGNSTGFSGDGGPATAAQLSATAVAVDLSGSLYIADSNNYRIRRVDGKTGIITTIAGNGQPGTGPYQTYAGTTGQATQIAIGYPNSIAVSPAGEVHWATPGRVLKVDSSGILSIVAGNGGQDYAGDGGPAVLASISYPFGLAFDSAGDLFVGEAVTGTVRRIDASTGVIQTVAGTGTKGVSADSIPATQAPLSVAGVAFAGNSLYIVDLPQPGDNARIRAVTPPLPPAMPQPPKITRMVTGVDFQSTFSPGSIVSILGNYLAPPTPVSQQIGQDGGVATTLADDTVTFNGTSGPLLYVSAAQINSIVPFATKTGTTPVQVQTSAGTDNTSIGVMPASPAVFAGLVFNPDGSLNSATNPAPKGATLVLYGTGMGQTSPPLVDGTFVQGPAFPAPVTQFSALLGNLPSSQYSAQIAYIGPMPGFVAGAMQVNVRIPDSVPAGPSTLALTSAGGGSSQAQNIYLLSDPPVLTGITPASPIPQTLGSGNYLTLNGSNLIKITAVNFYLSGKPINLQPQSFQACTTTSCTYFVSFNGQAGDYAVEVVNVAGQVSNRLAFTVMPIGPPTITYVGQPYGGLPLVATKGIQSGWVVGTNFQTPLSADIFYNGSRIATLSSSNFNQLSVASPTGFYFYFDFQGNAGQYGMEAVASDGSRSARFSFTVAAP